MCCISTGPWIQIRNGFPNLSFLIKTSGNFTCVAGSCPILSDAAELFHLVLVGYSANETAPDRAKIVAFASDYLDALHAAKLAFAEVARGNLRKARGAFIAPSPEDLVDFDAEFGVEEQLPRTFKIRMNQRGSGRSYLQWNGVFIGDPLTDNIADPDGYRFHDVFHFAHSAILHWSPVMRALIKHKRKSKPDYDEVQDGGRAIVVEEGLTAWIFTRAKELNFFEGQDRVSLGMLKTIGEFVAGYEVHNVHSSSGNGLSSKAMKSSAKSVPPKAVGSSVIERFARSVMRRLSH